MNSFYCILLATISLLSCFATYDESQILYYNSLIPPGTELRERILTTTFCEDCKDIPSCIDAGQIIAENDTAYQLMHNGIKIIPDCYYGKWMTVLIKLLKGHHEPQEEKAFYEVLKYLPDDAVMLELGCYWGYYSLWFQKELPRATNYLIEPDIKNLLIGQKNFSLNNLKGNFTHAMLGNHSSDGVSFINWDYETSIVPQVSVDDFARTKEIPYIHILHSDIQGAEIAMLEGCKELIKEKKIGYFFLSTHRGMHEKCLEILSKDFIILLSITREESFSADGLIVAKSPHILGPLEIQVTKRTQEIQNLIRKIANENAAN